MSQTASCETLVAPPLIYWFFLSSGQSDIIPSLLSELWFSCFSHFERPLPGLGAGLTLTGHHCWGFLLGFPGKQLWQLWGGRQGLSHHTCPFSTWPLSSQNMSPQNISHPTLSPRISHIRVPSGPLLSPWSPHTSPLTSISSHTCPLTPHTCPLSTVLYPSHQSPHTWSPLHVP